jgi:hypothetical protein
MTEKQQKLYDAIQEIEKQLTYTPLWDNVVKATHNLCAAIEAKEEHYDAGFPPHLERAIDGFAFRTEWLYTMLERASKSRRKTGKKIRQAMGYNV